MAIRLSGLFQSNTSDMQTNQSAQNNRANQTAQGSRANAASSSGSGNQSNPVQVQSLKPGQTIVGQIVSRDGNDIQLKLSGDTVIHARMEQSISASAGQHVTFEVGSNQSGMLALRPLFQNMAQDSTAMKALAMAGIDANESSLQMVSAMMEEGMSISKDSLQGMYRQVAAMPEADVKSMVQMTRMGIPVTPENVQQFEAYKNYEHKLISAFTEVAEEIPDAVSSVFEEQGSDAGNALIQKLMNVFDSQDAQGTPVNLSQTLGLSEAAAKVLEQSGALEQLGIVGQTEVEQKTDLETQLIDELTSKNGIAEEASGQLTNQEIVGQEGQENTLGTLDNTQNKQEAGTVAADNLETTQSFREMPYLNNDDRTQLVDLLKNAGVNAETTNRLLNGDMTEDELYHTVKDLSTKATSEKGQTAVKDLFLSQGFQKVFQNKMSEQWSFRPEDVDKKEVAKLYERLNDQTKQLTQALADSVKTDSSLYKSVTNIRENMDFMNQLNQIYSYVQLPLKFQGENAHGDLYVYTNKKNLARKDGNVSAFLHLDMEHLGTVDVYVAMENEKINTNFYLQDESSLDLLEKNMDILTKRLMDKGYQMNAKLQMKEDSITVMDEIIETDKNASVVSELSFDVRA